MFEVPGFVHVLAEVYPELEIVEGGGQHGSVFEDDLAEEHEFVDLLGGGRGTTDLLLVSSILRQMSVMYST